MSGEDYVGICIGKDGIAVAFVENGEEKPSLGICEYRACPMAEDRADVLEQIVQDLGLEDRPCVINLAPTCYESFLVEAQAFNEQTKVAVLSEAVREFIEFPLEEAVLEYLPLPAPNNTANEMAYVVAAKKTSIDKFVDLVTAAGLNPRAVDICETGMRNIARHLDGAEDGVLFLHLDPEFSQLLLIRGTTICMMRKLDMDVSPLFPSEDGISQDVSLFADIFAESLSAEIERSMNYCETMLGQKLAQKVVVAPMKADLDDILSKVEATTGIPIRMMNLNESLYTDDGLMLDHQQRCLFAVGSAMREGLA